MRNLPHHLLLLQLQLGTNEYAALVILQLREVASQSTESGRPSRRYSNFGNSTAAVFAETAVNSRQLPESANTSVSCIVCCIGKDTNDLYDLSVQQVKVPGLLLPVGSANERDGAARRGKVSAIRNSIRSQ
jgi:hypothetical protein